jgi:hypothetical protein
MTAGDRPWRAPRVRGGQVKAQGGHLEASA